jgi:hypothetical protein
MKKLSLIIAIFSYYSIQAQVPVTITKPSTADYKCDYGDIEITGYNAEVIRCTGKCYKYRGGERIEKKSDNVFFDRNTLNYLPDYVDPGNIIAYSPFVYDICTDSSLLDLKPISEQNFILCRTFPSPWDPQESFVVEYGYRIENSTGTNAIGGQYSSFMRQPMGISIAKYNKDGDTVWSHIIPRVCALQSSSSLPSTAQPIFVIKGNQIYLIYKDDTRNSSAQTLKDAKILDVVTGSNNIVCMMINPNDGTYQKAIISTYNTKSIGYYFHQFIDLGNGEIAITGYYKSIHVNNFFRIKVE